MNNSQNSAEAARPAYREAGLESVRLLPGPVLERQRLNTRYLLELDPDRLLHNFRVQAGLPSSAQPLEGWEAPTCGLRGHFVGHYLSACARGYANADDTALGDRVALIVRGLAECQDLIGSGYLSAFPESDLDAIETRFEGAWASYYVLHKILAGLIDAHVLGRADGALRVATRLADYMVNRLSRLSPEQLEGMCRTDLKPNPTNEFGGIGEALQDLAMLSGQAKYDEASRLFDREWFVKPLMNHEDRLTGLHANTHIPMVLSLAKRYERTGELALRDAVAHFWEITALARSFVNGGSSGPRPDRAEKSTGGEHWPAAFKLANTLTPKNNESCVTHNMLRLTDALFRWTGGSKYADFYERAYFNHVLAMQHPGHAGGYLYDHPLAPRSRKKFGGAYDAFWCCYGSTVEAYECLTAGIYYLGDDEVRVNLHVPSELKWVEKGVVLRQETRFPEETQVRLVVRCDRPVDLSISVRIPGWAEGARYAVTGQASAEANCPVVAVRRTWQDGDVIALALPPRLGAECMPDDEKMLALRYGPLVLAALTDADLRLPATDAAGAIAALRPLRGAGSFATTLADGQVVELVPLNQVVDEAFGVYFRYQ